MIPLGLEPKTYCLEGSCSIQLSYGTLKTPAKLTLFLNMAKHFDYFFVISLLMQLFLLIISHIPIHPHPYANSPKNTK